MLGQSRFTFNFDQPSNDLTQIGFNSAPVTTTAIFDFANLRTLKTYQVVDNLTWPRRAYLEGQDLLANHPSASIPTAEISEYHSWPDSVLCPKHPALVST